MRISGWSSDLCSSDRLVGTARRDMHDGTLDDPLEAKSRLRVDVALARKDGGVFVDELAQVVAQRIDIGRTCAQHLDGGHVVQQRKQQVLDGNKFVPGCTGLRSEEHTSELQSLMRISYAVF